MKLYQAEWCPFSHRVRAKLTELGIDYEIVNVSASTKKREKLEEVAGTKAIPVLVDGERVISDSDEAIYYLEQKYRMDPEELELHRRELSPTVYGTLPFGVEDATERLREALKEDGIEVLEELDLFPYWEGEEPYKTQSLCVSPPRQTREPLPWHCSRLPSTRRMASRAWTP
jgi:glutaredoxin 3